MKLLLLLLLLFIKCLKGNNQAVHRNKVIHIITYGNNIKNFHPHNYLDAITWCKKTGGRLLEVKDKNEQQRVKDMVKRKNVLSVIKNYRMDGSCNENYTLSHKNACYMKVEEELMWYEARSHCVEREGDLVDIEESKHLKSCFSDRDQPYWLRRSRIRWAWRTDKSLLNDDKLKDAVAIFIPFSIAKTTMYVVKIICFLSNVAIEIASNTIRFPLGLLKAEDVNLSTLVHFCDFHAAATSYTNWNYEYELNDGCDGMNVGTSTWKVTNCMPKRKRNNDRTYILVCKKGNFADASDATERTTRSKQSRKPETTISPQTKLATSTVSDMLTDVDSKEDKQSVIIGLSLTILIIVVSLVVAGVVIFIRRRRRPDNIRYVCFNMFFIYRTSYFVQSFGDALLRVLLVMPVFRALAGFVFLPVCAVDTSLI
ncbi:hypothetical protein HELRODRAFT_183612 [Helobdella robusta]|uniref:C-type lectin domain-containing protein n=1 Tax=Helobdella robusta TaxID=6412 RepID=T1FJX6_HELRO|nr:hypothetical protein HELRODRAFT_183612 [Helobdella robusta]ESO10454.1 hypothetical protein HELRODRAFT_183612 [Helobdella robusta]